MTSFSTFALGSRRRARSLGYTVAALIASSVAWVAPAAATVVDHTYSMHACHFADFNDLTTCPVAGFCLPPKIIENDNIYTTDAFKLQPRANYQAGSPIAFMCPIVRTLTGASADIHAQVGGAGATDVAMKCTLYAVNKTGLPVVSNSGSLLGLTPDTIKALKLNGVGSDHTFNMRCELPIDQPTEVQRNVPSNWTATASENNGEAGLAIDAGGTGTRWTTAKPMANGQTFTLDMKAAKSFYLVVLDNSANDYPRAFDVQVSDNGTTFTTIFSDIAKTDLVKISVPLQNKRYLRIRQTGSAGDRWWSIRDLRVYAPSASNAASTLNAYRMEESSTTTDLTVRTYPSSVCAPKGPTQTYTAKLRYHHDGLTNRDTGNLTVECPLANPFSPSTPRTVSVAISEAKSGGGSSCRMTARYLAYSTDMRSSSAASSSNATGNFYWSFSDNVDYQDYIRFGVECTLTPNSSLRMLRLDSN